MGLVNKSSNRAPITYVALSRNEDYGFKLKGTEVGTDGQPVAVTKSYDNVTGIPVGFYVKEEPIYELVKAARAKGQDPRTIDMSKLQEDEIQHVATLMLKDPETQELVGVNFQLHESLGGKIVGMLNAARLNNALGQDFSLRTFYSPPKSKYNDSEKGRSSVNMRLNGSNDSADDLKPVFLNEDGSPFMSTEHPDQHAKLPMGVEGARVKGKPVWDFSGRNAVITNTAVVLLEHFKKPAQTPTEDESVDLGEAARAAAPAA